MNKNNIGIENTGDRNFGNWNSGYKNSGDWNSGNWNSGNWNSGDQNSGDQNSGNWNSGYKNSGDWNSGNWNSGNWNSGDQNYGYFNIDTPKIRIFGKETDIKKEDLAFPDFFKFELNSWIEESNMTDKEKKAYPYYITTGGYLKTREYKQAWIESWEAVKDKETERKRVMALPNFDAQIFFDITGIRIEESVTEELTLEEVCKRLGKTIKIIK